MSKRIELDTLHQFQSEVFRLIRNNRRVVLRAGRRWGKTRLLEYVAAVYALEGKKVGWFGPDYRRNEPTYRRLLGILFPLVTHKNASTLSLTLSTGGVFEVWSTSDEDAGRSKSYDLVVLDEATIYVRELTPLWKQAIMPTLIDRGGSAVMAGTPKGTQPDQMFYRACHEHLEPDDPTVRKEGWIEYHAPTRQNPFLDADEVAGLQSQYGALEYEQEIEAKFVDWGGAPFFLQEKWFVDGEPTEMPTRCDYVFATIDSALKEGAEHDGTAVVYWSKNSVHGPPLRILDWDVVRISGDLLTVWLPQVIETLRGYAASCGARYGMEGISGAWIEDKVSGTIMIQNAIRQGLPVHPISTKLTAMGKEERALSVSRYHDNGMVKITRHAHDKITNFNGSSRNHFLSQVVGFRPGAPRRFDDLLDCYTYGLSIGLGDGEGY